MRKFISFILCFLLIFEHSGLMLQRQAFARPTPSAVEVIAGQVDISGWLTALHNVFTPDVFRPLHLRFLSYNLQANNFQLFLDKGDIKNPKPQEIEDTTKTLMKYFFIGLTLPNDSLWVNLRPDAEDNIIDDYLAQTDIGRVMLEADVQLKKDTAKATSPETLEGREYWNKLYQKAGEIFGSENVTIPTLTRPWIVPDEIIIRETADSAYIYKATLKVMLEQDYLSREAGSCSTGFFGAGKDSTTYNFTDPRLKELNEYSAQLIRELIIPKLTKKINTSKRYAPLRQVYYSLLLARWFKQTFSGKNTAYASFIDRRNLAGLVSKDCWLKTAYFQSYRKSFKDGEYNVSEPVYTPSGQTIRSYFSGGVALRQASLQLLPAGGPLMGAPDYTEKLSVSGRPGKLSVKFKMSPVIQQQQAIPEVNIRIGMFSSLAVRLLGTLRAKGILKNRPAGSADTEKYILGNSYFNDQLGYCDLILQFYHPKTRVKCSVMIKRQKDSREAVFYILAHYPGGNVFSGYTKGIFGTGEVTATGDVPAELIKLISFVQAHLISSDIIVGWGFNYDNTPSEFDMTIGITNVSNSSNVDYLVYRDPESRIELSSGGDELTIKLSPTTYNSQEEEGPPAYLFNDSERRRFFRNKFYDENKNYEGRLPRFIEIVKQTLDVEGRDFGNVLDLGAGDDPFATTFADKNCKILGFDLGLPEEIQEQANVMWMRHDVQELDNLPEDKKARIKNFLGEGPGNTKPDLWANFSTVLISNLLNYVNAKRLLRQVGNMVAPGTVVIIQNYLEGGDIRAFSPRGIKSNRELMEAFDPRQFSLKFVYGFNEKHSNDDRVINLQADQVPLEPLTPEKAKNSKAVLYLLLERIQPKEGAGVISASPPLTQNNQRFPYGPGGIDFRNLPIVKQAISDLGAGISLPRINSINLDSEWEAIEKLVNSGIVPSSERIKEYAQASSCKGEIGQDKRKVIFCIMDILREEEKGNHCPADPLLKDILVVLDSGMSNQELADMFK